MKGKNYTSQMKMVRCQKSQSLMWINQMVWFMLDTVVLPNNNMN
jgi:hypothetical protein